MKAGVQVLNVLQIITFVKAYVSIVGDPLVKRQIRCLSIKFSFKSLLLSLSSSRPHSLHCYIFNIRLSRHQIVLVVVSLPQVSVMFRFFFFLLFLLQKCFIPCNLPFNRWFLLRSVRFPFSEQGLEQLCCVSLYTTRLGTLKNNYSILQFSLIFSKVQKQMIASIHDVTWCARFACETSRVYGEMQPITESVFRAGLFELARSYFQRET